MSAVHDQDHGWMQRAIALAEKAASQAEVPVGAVLVWQDQIIGEGYNSPISLNDPSAHAEMMALRAGALYLNNYRLLDTTLYVTLEPCLMCVGAMVHARVGRLVFGAYDQKAGAVTSKAQCLDFPFLNHRIDYVGGIEAERCGHLLSVFFKVRR